MKVHFVNADCVTPLARRQHLAEAVAKLADELDRGELAPSRLELRILAELCVEQFLPCEAARLHRWLGDV